MSTSTIYKTYTLQPNEQFTLPPGSELIGSTSVANLESTCTIPTLEDIACYELYIAGANDNNSESQPFENDSSSDWKILSISAGGQTYELPTPLNCDQDGRFFLQTLIDFIAITPSLSGIFLEPNWNTAVDGTRGGISGLCFKSLASVAQTIYLTLSTNFVSVGSTTYRVYANTFGTYTGIGQCTCTTS